MRRRIQNETRTLPEITVKGHKIEPTVNAEGIFSAELEDGEVVTSETMKGLRETLAATLEQKKKEARSAVRCFMLESYSGGRPIPAVYVGKRKGPGRDYDPCFMFDVGDSRKIERVNLARTGIEHRVLSPAMSMKEWARLADLAKSAEEALEGFLKANRFDPTKGAE